jgi:hypothetical protein
MDVPPTIEKIAPKVEASREGGAERGGCTGNASATKRDSASTASATAMRAANGGLAGGVFNP